MCPGDRNTLKPETIPGTSSDLPARCASKASVLARRIATHLDAVSAAGQPIENTFYHRRIADLLRYGPRPRIL